MNFKVSTKMSDPKGIRFRLNETKKKFETERKTNFDLETMEINKRFKSNNLSNKSLNSKGLSKNKWCIAPSSR